MHFSFRVGTFWYDPDGHGWHFLESDSYVPIGHGSFDGRDDGEEEGHVSPNGTDVSSAAKFPPFLMIAESNVTV